MLKKDIHFGSPMNIAVEPTTSCNLRCPECPTGQNKLTRPKGMHSFELFKKIIDENQKDLIYLILYFQGEPFLNPDFFNFVKYAESKKIYVTTSTNAHYLNDENAKTLVESGLDRIIISMDGFDQQTYSSYRIGGDFEKVKAGIKNLIYWKNTLRSAKPYIILQTLVLKTNEHQIAKIKKFGKRIGVNKVEFKSAQIYDYQNGNPLIPANNKYSRYKKQADGSFEIKNKLNSRCYKMFSSCVITWDGNMLPCCYDKDAEFNFGNVSTSSFQNILRTNDYIQFRETILKKRSAMDMCRNCTE